MRRFKATPQKKLVGMLILFVFVPLFLLWYVIFFLDNRPGPDTIAIIAAVALLALYFYLKYRKQISGPATLEGPPEPEELEPELDEEAEAESGEENLEKEPESKAD